MNSENEKEFNPADYSQAVFVQIKNANAPIRSGEKKIASVEEAQEHFAQYWLPVSKEIELDFFMGVAAADLEHNFIAGLIVLPEATPEGGSVGKWGANTVDPRIIQEVQNANQFIKEGGKFTNKEEVDAHYKQFHKNVESLIPYTLFMALAEEDIDRLRTGSSGNGNQQQPPPLAPVDMPPDMPQSYSGFANPLESSGLMAPTHEYERRMAICGTCAFYDAAFTTCRVCGCDMSMKNGFADNQCAIEDDPKFVAYTF